MLAAIAAVGVALVASSDNGSSVSPVNENDVQQQIDGIRELIQDNTKALAGDPVGHLPARDVAEHVAVARVAAGDVRPPSTSSTTGSPSSL